MPAERITRKSETPPGRSGHVLRPVQDKDELQTLGEQLARRKRELKAADGLSADTGGEEDEED